MQLRLERSRNYQSNKLHIRAGYRKQVVLYQCEREAGQPGRAGAKAADR